MSPEPPGGATVRGTLRIRIAGFGGQGVVMAGYALGHAAIHDGLDALQTQSHGSESRGGASKSDVILSTGEILDLAPTRLDILVCMSQPAVDAHLAALSPGGVLLFDSDLARPADPPARSLGVPATSLAKEKFGRDVVVNAIMLGALAGFARPVTVKSLREAIAASVPSKTVDLNLGAFDEGLRLATAAGPAAP